ncbi:Phosphotransferase enzyme family protein [Corynebacterium kutscheri]|uniref:Phosphotransferase enzyme family protein n=1 Tax=Corynebacterium kutscheri TaxID=35755 RepID=A0AB38VSU3_9CORY|nr:Phosphotransferase enzyme family protein [Corynebacterium kutscheri]VEH79731.1 Phosphotransferase enzyme family protein [Corynebacterium kutscheri]
MSTTENKSAMSEQSTSEIITIAEDLLSQRFGGTQQLSDVESLNGSGIATVLRARVAPSPFLQQRSVVIKYMPPTGLLVDDTAIVREIAAYQFTTSLSEEVRPGPVLLAHDADKSIVVITDSGDGDTFFDLLDTDDAELRISILRNLGEALGKMHADTASKEEDFLILLKRMLHKYPEAAKVNAFREAFLVRAIDVGQHIIEQQGIEVPQIVKDLAKNAARRLFYGQHRAFTPFDLSPDNIIVAERTHFLDYESAGFRDATFDIACVICGFPQFLFSRPIQDDEADVFIDSWVNEVGKIWPNVNNLTRLHIRITTAMIGWAFSSITLMLAGLVGDTFEDDYIKRQADDFDTDDLLTQFSDASKQLFDTTDDSREELVLVRNDLVETFESIERFAARGSDTKLPAVAQFARRMVDVLDS